MSKIAILTEFSIEAVKDALQQNGFHIPYPQRQLHFPEKAL